MSSGHVNSGSKKRGISHGVIVERANDEDCGRAGEEGEPENRQLGKL